MTGRVRKSEPRAEILCPHCGATNPPHAFCCVSCFKVIQEKQKTPLWKIPIRLNLPAIVVVAVVFGFIFMVTKKWLANVEAQITLNLSTTDYAVSVSADKRKREAEINVTPKNELLPPQQEDSSSPR